MASGGACKSGWKFFARSVSCHIEQPRVERKRVDCRSINIGGELRAVYKQICNEEYIFVEMGTSGELYSWSRNPSIFQSRDEPQIGFPRFQKKSGELEFLTFKNFE